MCLACKPAQFANCVQLCVWCVGTVRLDPSLAVISGDKDQDDADSAASDEEADPAFVGRSPCQAAQDSEREIAEYLGELGIGFTHAGPYEVVDNLMTLALPAENPEPTKTMSTGVWLK